MRRIALLCLALISCTPTAPTPGSLRVEVQLEDALQSVCIKVFANGTRERSTAPIDIRDQNSVVVGIVREDEPDETEIRVEGYSDEGCTLLTVPAERTTPTTVRFAVKGMLTVTLRPPDVDMDGYPAGIDCNDGQPDVHPGAIERCDNLTDDDCDGKQDCEAAACSNMQCHANGAVCVGERCTETRCADDKDDDGDMLKNCFDPDCDGKRCENNGLCVDAGCLSGSEMGLCTDGIDNDGDGFIDCADGECPAGTSCTDLNLCTVGETCNGTSCGGGTTISCGNPPGSCFATTGACAPATGLCEYAPDLNNTCTDFDPCTTDVCLADGGCGSTPIACTTPPPGCFTSTGTCSSGACTYGPAAAGAPCDDGSTCTVNDACNGIDSTCTGARPFCPPLTQCQRPAQTCSDAGPCNSVPWLGGCDAGLCDGAGACNALFPFVPSNFATAQLPPSSGALTLTCTSTVETRSTDGGVGWNSSCSIPSPTFRVINAGGVESVLVLVETLTVNAMVDLISTGPRPLIIAVSTNATINGRIVANAGAGIGCPGNGDGARGGMNATVGSGGGGAGFRNSGTNGSNGVGATSPTAQRGVAGQPSGNDALTPLHGGCRGGNGGRSSIATGGLGGNGGGVVQLTVAQNLTVTGRIIAAGRGGRGGHATTGAAGGGGGSGGGILLECSQFTLGAVGVVAANGGGGGEGAEVARGDDGDDGSESDQRADGGADLSCGGNGGEGGARTGAGAAEAPSTTGPCNGAIGAGAGGGGSGGRIRINAATGCAYSPGATISPNPTASQTSCIG